MQVSVLIPAYNEEERIAETVSAILGVPGVEEVLVVDDGSGDGTAPRAEAAGAKVLRLPRNCGKGGALNRGAMLARGELVAMLDADLGNTAGIFLPALLEPVRSGMADLVVACPAFSAASGLGLVRGLAGGGLRLLTGLSFRAPLSGQRAMRRDVWEALLPLPEGFGVEVGMTLKAIRAGFRIEEIGVEFSHRRTGRDWRGFRHRGRQFWHVLLTLAREGIRA